MKDISSVQFRRDVKLIKEMKLLQNSEKFMSFVIQSLCRLIANKILSIDHDFILNSKVFHIMLVICLLNHITLNFCEVVINDQEYFIHNFNNFCDRMNLELLLCCGSLCDIKIKEHVKTEIFIKIKWCYFDRLVNSIVISKFNY